MTILHRKQTTAHYTVAGHRQIMMLLMMMRLMMRRMSVMLSG